MKFTDLLKHETTETIVDKVVEDATMVEEAPLEEAKTPQEILRGAKFKIKLITPTSFGTQIDFAKQYDEEDIKDILKDFNVKIKNKSVFIVD